MRSIQYRLSTGLIISLITVFLVFWILTSSSIRQLAESYIVTRLQHDLETLITAIQIDQQDNLSLDERRISTVYAQPFSGHYYSIRHRQTQLRSRSLWDRQLEPIDTQPGEYKQTYQSGPENQALLVLTSRILKQGHPFDISVAEDLSPVLDDIQQFLNYFALTCVLALLLLLTGQLIILRTALKPLQQIQDELVELEKGKLTALSTHTPQELKPLVEKINLLLSALHNRLRRSRDALSDLSHTIKKPLTLLHQLSENVSEKAPEEIAHTLSTQVNHINLITDRILKRARLAGDFGTGAMFDFHTDFELLIQTIQNMYPHKSLKIKTNIPESVHAHIDREDMLELLGNVLDNACKWASNDVLATIHRQETLDIIIEDDGPGVDEQELQRLAQRGIRLDESVDGYGFGLAIASDIVMDYKGEIKFSRSETLKGFKVEIHLPLQH